MLFVSQVLNFYDVYERKSSEGLSPFQQSVTGPKGNLLGKSSYSHSAVITPVQLEKVIIGEAMTRIRAKAP